METGPSRGKAPLANGTQLQALYEHLLELHHKLKYAQLPGSSTFPFQSMSVCGCVADPGNPCRCLGQARGGNATSDPWQKAFTG